MYDTFVALTLTVLGVCLLSIDSAFLPNSKAKPNVNASKNTNKITKPYISFV